MKKAEEKKLRKQIVDLLVGKENYNSTNELLINELVDWLKIGTYNNQQMKDSVKNESTIGWNLLTTKSMVSKNVQSILTKLNLTPELTAKKKKEQKKEEQFNLQGFLNG